MESSLEQANLSEGWISLHHHFKHIRLPLNTSLPLPALVSDHFITLTV